jgi:hypothetical protein
MTKSGSSPVPSEQRADARRRKELELAVLHAERASAERADPLLLEALKCEQSRSAARVLRTAVDARGTFERDRTPLLPPACSLPPLV